LLGEEDPERAAKAHVDAFTAWRPERFLRRSILTPAQSGLTTVSSGPSQPTLPDSISWMAPAMRSSQKPVSGNGQRFDR
jgi:hypothetical protein